MATPDVRGAHLAYVASLTPADLYRQPAIIKEHDAAPKVTNAWSAIQPHVYGTLEDVDDLIPIV